MPHTLQRLNKTPRRDLASQAISGDLNAGPGFAATNDWRLPTFAELLMLLNQPHPCTTSPCVDAAFGTTLSGHYWSSTTAGGFPAFAWFVDFADGDVGANGKAFTTYVRAVRGGL